MAKIISSQDFNTEVLESELPVVVDFFATWCGPCKMIAPVLDELSKELEGRAKIVKVDTDKDPALANQYGIVGVPTLIFFKGGKIVDQVSGALPKPALAARVNSLL